MRLLCFTLPQNTDQIATTVTFAGLVIHLQNMEFCFSLDGAPIPPTPTSNEPHKKPKSKGATVRRCNVSLLTIKDSKTGWYAAINSALGHSTVYVTNDPRPSSFTPKDIFTLMWIRQSRPQPAPFGAHSGGSTDLLDTAVTGTHKPKHSSNNYLDIRNWREDTSSKYG